mgnify:CR=1 FL=1
MRNAVSEVIVQELVDPRMGFVTVTKVEVSADFRSAQVFVSVIGSDADQRKTFRGLVHAAGFIQRRVAEKVELKNTPRLRFERDDSVKRSIRIAELLRRAVGGESDESGSS